MPLWLLIANVAVGLLAAAFLAWSLRGDPSRGRRRCPKCWYDMSAGGLSCPECGHIATSERALLKRRRHRRRALISFLLLLAAAATPYGYRLVTRGWHAAPTTVLILASPWELKDPAAATGSSEFVQAFSPRLQHPLPVWQQRLLASRLSATMKSDIASARGIAAIYASLGFTAGNPGLRACIPELIAGVDDPDDKTAYCFVDALTRLTLGDSALEPLWERLLALGRTEDIRATAAAMLAWLARAGDSRGFVPLMRAVLDPSQQVQQQVAFALGKFDNPGAVLALVYMLGQRSDAAMGGACVSLWQLEDRASPAVPALMQAIESRARGAGWAPIALGRIGPAAKPAVPLLISRLQDTSDPQRRARSRSESAIALGRIGDARPEVIAALRAGLDDPSIPVQHGCLEGLARLAWAPGPDRARITSLANADDLVFRIWARMILAHNDATLDALVPELMALTTGQEWWVCVAAIEALDSLGARAAPALPVLEPLCSPPPPAISAVDDQVQQAANPAVRHIKAAIAGDQSK